MNTLCFYVRSPPGVGGDGQCLLVWSTGCSVSTTGRQVSPFFFSFTNRPFSNQRSSYLWSEETLLCLISCSCFLLFPQHGWDGHREHLKGRADHGFAVRSSGPSDPPRCLHHSHLQGLPAATLRPDCAEQQCGQPLQQRFEMPWWFCSSAYLVNPFRPDAAYECPLNAKVLGSIFAVHQQKKMSASPNPIDSCTRRR